MKQRILDRNAASFQWPITHAGVMVGGRYGVPKADLKLSSAEDENDGFE